MTNAVPLHQPLFNPDLIANVLTPAWLRTQIDIALATLATGEPLRFGGERLDPTLLGTLEALRMALPHPAHCDALQHAVLDILKSLQALNLLHSIPHGADRGIRAAVAWNSFVKEGTVDTSTFRWTSLLETPLAKAIGQGLWYAGANAICDLRKDAGLNAFAGRTAQERVGDRVALACTASMIDAVCIKATEMAALYGSGQKPYFSHSDSFSCPKTDIRLQWAEDHLLNPAIQIVDYAGNRPVFTPLDAYAAPKPLRCVPFKAPSGTLLMADWFRIPEFTEGIEPDDFNINTDKGVDERTQDHFERLGLLRVHTTNCVPSVVDDRGVVRVTRIDEDHEDLWEEDPNDPDSHRPSGISVPPLLGSVCCDLWDVTFADREYIVDVIMRGAQRIKDNGGMSERNGLVQSPITTREEAYKRLDAYVAEHDVVVLPVTPGASLYLYMATGGSVRTFAKTTKNTPLASAPWLEDYFVITATPVALDPSLVDTVAWVQPPLAS